MNINYKSFKTEYKIDLKKNEFQGHAAAFDNIDAGGDIIRRGAFKKTINEFTKRIKVLWQHDPHSPIGKAIHLEEDSKGLFVHAKISETTLGKDAMVLMRDGVVNELSIGYDPKKFELNNDTGIRELLEVKLWEFSPVTWAMNDMATISAAKDITTAQAIDQLNKVIKSSDKMTEEEVKSINDILERWKALTNDQEPSKDTPSEDKPSDDLKSLLNPLQDIISGFEIADVEKRLKSFAKKLN